MKRDERENLTTAARAMLAAGRTHEEVAKALGVTTRVLRYWTDPEYAAKCREASRRSRDRQKAAPEPQLRMPEPPVEPAMNKVLQAAKDVALLAPPSPEDRAAASLREMGALMRAAEALRDALAELEGAKA